MSDEPTADELNEEIAQSYGHLFEINSLLVGAGRQEIEHLTTIRDTYLELADEVNGIIEKLIYGIAMTARTTGDILMAQYGITPEEVEEYEED